MKRTTVVATLYILGSLPLAALAADPGQPSTGAPAPADPAAASQVPSMFKQLDTNGDGYISKAEAERSASVKASFTKLDSDHDGRISVQEYTKGMKGQS